MREIIFRGRREYNGEWVEGSLLLWPDGSAEICYPHPDREEELLKVIVDPDTVGQYTGLKDKNGKKIFEGDIVRYFQRLLGGEDYEHKDPVLFLEGGFTVGVYFVNNWLRDGTNGNIQLEGIEVIGNIHDNPELLGGADND